MHRRTTALIVALGVLLTLIASSHAYLAQRLIAATALPEPWSGLGNAAIALLAALIVANPLAERALGPRVGRVLGWPAYVWLGSCFYLLLGLWLSDAGLMMAGLHGLEVERTRALFLCASAACVVLLGMRSALSVPAVKRVELVIDGWPCALDGYRIVQLSDIHIGSLLRRSFARRLVERCNQLQPDLLAITGDLVDGSVPHLRDEVVPFSDLRARDGVYFVTGNHDHYSGADRWVQCLQGLGVPALRNQRVRIERAGAAFELAGVDDLSSRRLEPSPRGFDLDAALAGWDPAIPLVLLAHDPRTFELAGAQGVHLQLSGHTHDGQLWPFRFLVRLQTRFLAGVYRRGRSTLYVSRGTGFWGPPMRVLAPAEITELVLMAPKPE